MDAVRTHLSPEVVERYGEAHRSTAQLVTEEGRHDGGNELQSIDAANREI